MVDDLGYNDVNFRNPSSNDMYTPNINRLSQEGVNVQNAYMMQDARKVVRRRKKVRRGGSSSNKYLAASSYRWMLAVLGPSAADIEKKNTCQVCGNMGPTSKNRQIVGAGILCLLALSARGTFAAQPHIVVIMVDDLGYNDVNFRNPSSSDMYTPNINRLSQEGVNVPNAYMMQMCTPSRAAFMTGIYPFRYGMQHRVLSSLNNGSMPLDRRVLPERLRELGYKNYLVGKWHLGFCNRAMTPASRGFDYFYGSYNGVTDHFSHISKFEGYDQTEEVRQSNDKVDRRPAWEAEQTYSTDVYTNKAIEYLQNHNKSQPLFLWLSYQAVHGPLQVPQSYISQYCSHIDTTLDAGKRQLKCAMTAAVDEGVGKMREALDRLGYSDNVLTLFLSDNGGPTSEGANNDPLQGSKTTLWEGGVRVPLVLHSKRFFASQYNANSSASWGGVIHAVDWYPTLLKAAGDTVPVSNIDGANYWDQIQSNNSTARQWTVININDVKKSCAIRYLNYKLHRNGPLPVGGANDGSLEKVFYKLYDLSKDPSELTNIKGKADKQTILQTMQDRLWQEIGTLHPANNYKDILRGMPENYGGIWSTGWC